MNTRIVVVVMVAAAALARAPRAHGDAIVLESYTGERPGDATRLLAPVLEELSRKKFTAGDGVARQFETQVSRAGQRGKGVPADFSAQVDKGFKAWVGGDFDASIKILVPLIETAHANSGQFAVQPALRDPLQKALIALSLAQQRIGDAAAMRATMTELMRSFPEATISRATYGPDAQKAFEEVRREVNALGRGKLEVKVADESGVVFIDEAYRAVGSTVAELIPGEYRVLVVANKQPSRTHHVTVRANEQATVTIDASFDLAVRTSGYTGLAFKTDNERLEREAPYAAQFARAIGADAVAVVGIDNVRGKASVVGALISLQTGREIRRASIPLEPDPSNERLAALARFLGGEEPAAGLNVQFANASEERRREREPEPASYRWGGWRWITGALGLGGLVTGAVLVGLDGRCNNEPPPGTQCLDLYVTAQSGYIALGGGAVFTAIAIYLFATHKEPPLVVVKPVAEGGATVWFTTSW